MPQRFSHQGVIYYNRNPLNRTPREPREDLIPLVLIFFSVNTQTSRKLELLFVSLGSSSQRNSTVVFYALNCTYQKKKTLVMFTTLSPSLPPPPVKKVHKTGIGVLKNYFFQISKFVVYSTTERFVTIYYFSAK